MRLPPRMTYQVSGAVATLLVDEQPWTSWDTGKHPWWPPVDSDGELIGDVPWKFFEDGDRNDIRHTR